MTLGPRGRSVPLWVCGLLVGAACAVVPFHLLVRALEGGVAAFWKDLSRPAALALLGRSAALAAAVGATSAVLGVALAWITARTDIPGRRFFVVALTAPLAIPSYVGAYLFLAGIGAGGAFRALVPWMREYAHGFPAAWVVLTMLSFPYVFLTVRAALRRTPPSIEEAARGLGCGQWATFFRVVLPQLVPAIGSGTLLVCLYTLSDFGAVSLLRCKTFTSVIYSQYGNAFERTRASRTAVMLVVLALVFIGAEYLFVRRRAHVATPSEGRPRSVSLGRWRWPAIALSAGTVALAVGGPLVVLATWCVRGGFDAQYVGEVFGRAVSSVHVSSLAAVVAAIVAIPVAVLAVRRRGVASTLLERATYVGFALPGIVIALSLVAFSVRHLTPLYQSLTLLIGAYVVHFLPQSLGATRASLLQVDPRLEEAARSLGRGPLRAFREVTLPLVLPGVLAGAALVFLTTMKELPATLMLGPTEFRTLATEVWTQTEEAYFAKASVPALFLILLAGVPMLAVLFFQRREALRG